tara:strand:- start:605 stop:727 length:123 start_codon:yes stop_codon:yes gene_type:complete
MAISYYLDQLIKRKPDKKVNFNEGEQQYQEPGNTHLSENG